LYEPTPLSTYQSRRWKLFFLKILDLALSIASVLLFWPPTGLAIVFGLMGVINLATGG